MTAPTRSGGGRYSQLTDELQERIVTVVRAGNYLKVAAQFSGIGESTLRSWLTRGRRAVAAVEAHDPEALYCPQCDLDRTAEVDAEREANRREEEAGSNARAVLDNCPRCRTVDSPRTWQLPAEEERYRAFLAAVTAAETVGEVAAVGAWRKAFDTDWRAARDYLVRRQPDRWAARTRISISSEEAEQRMERAVTEALTTLGIDVEGTELDPEAGPLLDDLERDYGDDTDHDPGDW